MRGAVHNSAKPHQAFQLTVEQTIIGALFQSMSTANPGANSDEAFFREKFIRDAHRLFKANGESKLEYLSVAKGSNGIVVIS